MTIETVADILRTHAAERPERVALELGDREVTWGQLYERASRVAQALLAAGVGPQDRVAFIDKNGVEHFEVVYGGLLANIVTVEVNWRLAPPEVAYIVGDAGAKVLIVGPDFVPLAEQLTAELPDVRILAIGGGGGFDDYDAWVEAADAVDPRTPTGAEETALQLYSSGTTGLPKGVLLSNHNMCALIPAGLEIWDFDADAVNLVAMPLFHIGGLGWAIVGQYIGARSVILRELDPTELLRLFGERGITHGFVVPAVLQFLLMMPDVADVDYSSLRMLAYGASPISEDVLARSITTFGCDFFQVYGLTETTGAVFHLLPADHDLDGPNTHRLRSCGQPGPGVEVRIIDNDSGAELATGEVGEIQVRGPQIMLGYWNREDATREAIDDDGWFRTGDAGYLDADGYLYIHDRVKDMIVSGGENIYPAEIENALMSHPGVADVAVIGVPDDKWGESPKALVVAAAGVEVTADDVIAFARTKLAGFKIPKSVDFIETLPRNPSGKILKKDLRAPYWEGRERQVN